MTTYIDQSGRAINLGHLLLGQDPLSIRLGLAFYADPKREADRRHQWHRFEVARAAHRVYRGGDARARRRLRRSVATAPLSFDLDGTLQITKRFAEVEDRLTPSTAPQPALPCRRFVDALSYALSGSAVTLMLGFAWLAGIRTNNYWINALMAVGALVGAVLVTFRLGWVGGYSHGLWLAVADAVEQENTPVAPCATPREWPPPVVGRGYLYVIRFSTGTIKVGQTMSPRSRLADHRNDAAAFGVVITNFWISTAHKNYRANETTLIESCVATSSWSRVEYFHDLDYNATVRAAKTICGEAAATAAVGTVSQS